MFNGKNKALTFSYDDGVSQDVRMIEILNKYNLKCTFNLNSGLFGKKENLIREGVPVTHNIVEAKDVRALYEGHEVAVHTLTHPDLTKLSDEDIIREVEEDRIKLSELVGYEVVGMAYPFGGCNERVANILRDKTGVKYSRAVSVTHSFEPYEDLYIYKGTLYHHGHWDELFKLGEEFLNLKTDTPKVFYIWGHAYEFDIAPDAWEKLEKFCQMMSGKDDIFYGTNKEILLK